LTLETLERVTDTRPMRSTHVGLVVALVAATSVASCQNKIQSSLTVNGAPFQPNACRNGTAVGFFGVEFSDATGARLRLQSTVSGSANAYYFAPGAPMPAEFFMCGTLSMMTQNSTVNRVRNVQGNATLNCTNAGASLQGTIQFENCH
jgi:hypothetical protein